MIDYLITYFAIGVGLLAATFLFVLIRDWNKGHDFPNESFWITLTVFLGVVLVWPAILVFLVIEYFKNQSGRNTPLPKLGTKPEFRVEPQHLVRHMSVAEIEACERVYDPLGAAPDLPFGHLNAIWSTFAAQLQPSDETWRFEAEWRSETEPPRRFRGYAALREGVVAKYLVISSRYLDLS